MAGCGYVCPVCEGRGFIDSGETCTFCTPEGSNQPKTPQISDETWMKEVHEGNCCADRPEDTSK